MSFMQSIFGSVGAHLHRQLQGDEILHYPLGVKTNPQTRTGVLIDKSGLLGTNEVTGDGAVTRDGHGDRERRTARIELLKSIVVTRKDLWYLDGEWFSTIRKEADDVGADGTMYAWRIVAIDPDRTQHSILKPTQQNRS